MKFAVFAFAGCVLTSGTLLADSINVSSGAAWTPFASVFNPAQPDPTSGSQGTPFWNNWSTDTGVGGSHDTNVGYFLSGTGGFAGTDALGLDSATAALLTDGGGDPSAVTFTPNAAQTYTVTLLGAYSGNDSTSPGGTQFGIYYTSGGTTILDQLYGPGANAYTDKSPITITGAPRGASSYGFYATVCYGGLVNGVCPNTETFYSDSSLNTGWVTNNPQLYGNLPNYNHFALFGLGSDNGSYGTGNWVIAFKDGPVLPEGMGDFQDIVIELADPTDFPVGPTGAPEPATFAIVGTGLAALAFVRRHAAKR